MPSGITFIGHLYYMANEFVARKGIISSGSVTLVTGSFVGPLLGTASFATSASYALVAENILVLDGSPDGVPEYSGSFTGSLLGTASNAISSSYAVTASYALNVEGGGGGLLSSSVVVDSYLFVGDGITTEYLVSKSYEESSVTVTVGGLTYVIPGDFSISGSTVVFVEAPLSSSNISVKALMNVTQDATGSFSGSFAGDGSKLFNISAPLQVDTYTFDADGIQTIFPLDKVYSSDAVIVSVDGLTYVSPADYTVAGTTVTFVDIPTSGSTISVKGFINTSFATGSYSGSFIGDGSGLTTLPISVTKDVYQFTANGVSTNYSLARLYDINSLNISVAGLRYAPLTDYTLSLYTVSFLSAPPSGANIYIDALVNTPANATGSFSGSFIGNFDIVTASVAFAQTASFVSAATDTAVTVGNIAYGGITQQFGTGSGFNFFTPVGSGSAYQLIINGKDTADGTTPSNAFMDIVVFQNQPSPIYNVLVSTVTAGAPGARTYSTDAGNVRIAVASGTNWYVDAAVTKLGS
jgi:hypothetical protein